MATCLPDSTASYPRASPLGHGLIKQENSVTLSPAGLPAMSPHDSAADYAVPVKSDEQLPMTAAPDEQPLRASENVYVCTGQLGGAQQQSFLPVFADASLSCPTAQASICAVCQEPIYSRFLLVVSGAHYHEACLRCSSCHLPLIEVGNKCYRNRAGANLCEKDYALFRQRQSFSPRNTITDVNMISSCNGCFQPLRPTDWVTVVYDKKYHAECFVCCSCQQRLVKGSNFVMLNNQIWCEKDYQQSRLATAFYHRPDTASLSPVATVCHQPHQRNVMF